METWHEVLFLWMLAGLISPVRRFFALANPLAATLTAELLAGWMFVIVGIATLVFGAWRSGQVGASCRC